MKVFLTVSLRLIASLENGNFAFISNVIPFTFIVCFFLTPNRLRGRGARRGHSVLKIAVNTQDLVRKVARLGALLEGAKRVVFFTGAGVSVEAGIPGDSIYFCF